MRLKKHILFLLITTIVFLCFSFVYNTFKEKKRTIFLSNPIKKSKAGSPIEFDFENNVEGDVYLFLHNSFGKTILLPNFKFSNKTTFIFPENYTKRAGVLKWRLVQKNKTLLQGAINILPLDNLKNDLEGYLGPPSTWVGSENYVMYVTIPIDKYDNSLAEETPINHSQNIHNSITNEEILVKDLIIWKRIYSPTKSGKIFMNSNYKNKNTKEFVAEIYPGIAMPFTIYSNRIHDFADGNQLTTIKTSVLKDKYGNVVSNGTLVVFEYTNSKNEVLKSFASTIDGVATTEWIHPEVEESYTVKAKITDLSTSNTINLSYKPWDFDIEYKFFNKNRKLKIGPLLSYNKQWIANGINVKLKVFSTNKLKVELIEKTINGEVQFLFEEHLYPHGIYTFELETLGKKLKFNNVQLK